VSKSDRARSGRAASVAPLDPERLVRVLAAHRVDYVMVGALAARLQGFPRLTADMDVTPARNPANLDRLAAALTELGARVFTDGVPEGLGFDITARTLANAEVWNLVTDAGRLDVLFAPAGTGGFEDLHETSVRFEVFGVTLEAAHLEDIIRSKSAADRPQDRQDVVILREMVRRAAENA
jgi:hypothetical protein